MPTEIHCPLCNLSQVAPTGSATVEYKIPLFHEDKTRQYLRCEECALVFVPAQYHLDAAAEKAEYDQHENNLADAGYHRFLTRLADPLLARIEPGARGLDFGCGPGPLLAKILEEAGCEMCTFDPFFDPDTAALRGQYDFVCATEVVEHLRAPGYELQRLWDLLPVGGVLAVMTKLVESQEAFAAWHYIRDPTHISFFSRETWRWWAAGRGAALEFVGADVMFLRRTN